MTVEGTEIWLQDRYKRDKVTHKNASGAGIGSATLRCRCLPLRVCLCTFCVISQKLIQLEAFLSMGFPEGNRKVVIEGQQLIDARVPRR